MPDSCRTSFPKIDEDSKCLAIDLVSRLGCVADGALLDTSSTADRPKYSCKYCTHTAGAGSRSTQLNLQAKADALATFMRLLSHEPFLNSQRLRVSAMVSIRRLIVHNDNHELYALESSDIGQWCLQSLTSSIRELRIAAG
jgi:serine/threonine-protein kinase ATR